MSADRLRRFWMAALDLVQPRAIVVRPKWLRDFLLEIGVLKRV